ncbi:hypothetical protein D3C85_1438070 [compost metagenome]
MSRRWAARKDKVRRSQALSSQAWSAVDNPQYWRRPGRSRKALAQPWRCCWMSRAAATCSAMVALLSPWLLLVDSAVASRATVRCRSMRSSKGPESLLR